MQWQSHLICHEMVHMSEHCDESPSSHQIGAQVVDVHIIAGACHDGQQRSVWLASKHSLDRLLHHRPVWHIIDDQARCVNNVEGKVARTAHSDF